MAMAATTVRGPRTIKNLEKPKPLKIQRNNSRTTIIDTKISTVDDIVSLVDNVATQLNNGFYDQNVQSNIVTMCNHLKLFSHQLEGPYKDQLDRAFVAIRNASQDDKIDIATRVYLLELIELRAKQWQNNDYMNTYYSQKLANLDTSASPLETPTNLLSSSLTAPITSTSPPMLEPGEVLKSSGKFLKPTRIPGKTYCKDEVVIRNSDSGKVNPGAKERLVQITGTGEDKITYAKDLIRDTIQRNASPVRLDPTGQGVIGVGESSSSLNSSASEESNRLHQPNLPLSLQTSLLARSFSTNDASIGEFKYTVKVGEDSLKITGTNIELVQTAKLVLEDYFSEVQNHRAEYFTYSVCEEENSFAAPLSNNATPITPLSAGQTSFIIKNTSTPAVATINENHVVNNLLEPKKKEVARELSYEFLMQCSKGPYAKQLPEDWDRIQKEFPAIVKKVELPIKAAIAPKDKKHNNIDNNIGPKVGIKRSYTDENTDPEHVYQFSEKNLKSSSERVMKTPMKAKRAQFEKYLNSDRKFDPKQMILRCLSIKF